jgi:alkyl sulfatase BDS1-like metallo-beta-lactamase superfamily hydrolase
MLESIVEQVLNGLNAGQRQDLVVDAVQLPERFIHDHDARELYVTAKDIARMVIKEHSGWWDDIPSNWNPPPLKRQAEEIIRLAGGIDAAIIHAQKLAEQDTSLAIRFADWIWLAHPENKEVIRASLTLYGRHVSTPRPTQEALVCAEHMIRLQEKLSSLTPP